MFAPLLTSESKTHAAPAQDRHTPFFQPKLTVNTPGDKHEQEADRVADQVMRMRDGDTPSAQRISFTTISPSGEAAHRKEKPAPHFFGNEPIVVQRKCAECEKEEKEGVQRESLSPNPSPKGEGSAPPIVSDVLSSGSGQPMDSGTQQFMESRFGQDFSQVRIHTDSRAAESAEAIQARAYTSGRDVVFGSGEYQPQSESGKRLLAHELVHVGQQQPNKIARQPEFDPFPPRTFPGPEPPEELGNCEIDLLARKWQDFINCCAKTPLGKACSKDIISVICKIPGVNCGDKKKEQKNNCPPGFKPGGSSTFKDKCCPEKIVAENARDCCPPHQITGGMFPRCCPPGQSPDAEGKNCEKPAVVPFPKKCLPGETPNIFGGCCKPGETPRLLGGCCKPGDKDILCPPPAPTPVPPGPSPSPSVSSNILFKFDRPHIGEKSAGSLSSAVMEDGKANFEAVVKQLENNPNLRVQLIGKASPEGNEEYNLQLSARRAMLVRSALSARGISGDRIADSPNEPAPSGCLTVQSGVHSCGEAGATGPEDRVVEVKLFEPNPVNNQPLDIQSE